MKYIIVAVLIIALLTMGAFAQQEDNKKACNAKVELQKMNAVVEGFLQDWDRQLELLKKEEQQAKKNREEVDYEKIMIAWGKKYLNNQDELLQLEAQQKKISDVLQTHDQIHKQLVENLDVDDIASTDEGKDILTKFQKKWMEVKKDLEADLKELAKQIEEAHLELGKLVDELKKFETKTRDMQVIHQMAKGEIAAYQALEDEHSQQFEDILKSSKEFVDKHSECPKTCFDFPCRENEENPICVPKEDAKEGEELFECKALPDNCEEVTCAQGFECKMLPEGQMLQQDQPEGIKETKTKTSQAEDTDKPKLAPICIRVVDQEIDSMARQVNVQDSPKSNILQDDSKQDDSKQDDKMEEDIEDDESIFQADTKKTILQEDTKDSDKDTVQQQAPTLKQKMKEDIVEKEEEEADKNQVQDLLADLFGTF